MIKLETHAHSAGSPCAKCLVEDLILDYKKAGYGAIAITNHYSEYYYRYNDCSSIIEYANKFLKWIEEAEFFGKKHGIKIFYGLEVRLIPTATEYMLYGFKKEFLLENPELFNLTQAELFALCEKNNIFMYQTHPFRDGVKFGDPKFMHGAEYFNGHFHHLNNNYLAEEFCEKNNLIKLSGTDFHCKDQPITSGLYIPEDINDSFELTDYIRSGKAQLIREKQYYKQELIKFKKSIGIELDYPDEKI